ncbi:MAG: hypothetical protein P1V51_08010 [Deltaproteobacteria bacterium]|nr:hypothetical protein [Deltaproteobacteria bacterium]
MTRFATLWILLIPILVGLTGCSNCRGEGLVDAGIGDSCTTNDQCMERFGARYLCLDGTCCPGARFCEDEGEAECCPGQTCSRNGVCVDRYDACSEDVDCTVAGQKCLDHTTGGLGPAACNNEPVVSQVCTFELCTDGACADGLTCFAGFCVGENPCGGACSFGQVCSVSNNRCQAAPLDNSSCAQTCDAGYLLAFDDHTNIDDACTVADLTCDCLALPPLSARDVGRHSALGLLSDGSALVSAYEGDHGDLVVVAFGADGTRGETTWIDGLPAGGTPTADPNGPRGGIADPGPEVGRYTDIAVASGDVVHVSYYDVENSALRYARRSAGAWTFHTVDEAGDVGRYSAIAVDGSGIPVIAYFQKESDSDPLATALKVARAKSATPGAAADWDFVTVEAGNAPPPPCPAGCATGEFCADLGAGPACQTERADCAPACASGEVCVDDGGAAACSEELSASALDDLPVGVGLMPALWVTSAGSVTVAYHDRIRGTLDLAVGVNPSTASAGTGSTVAGGGGEVVGLFPAIALDGAGEYVIIHRDDSTNRVLWNTVTAAGAAVDNGVVDDGLRDPSANGVSLVGSDNALVLNGGQWLVAYHDGTGGNLVLASRATDGTWTRRDLVTDGSAGFWADIALAGGQLRVSHATLRGARIGPLFTDLGVVLTTP